MYPINNFLQCILLNVAKSLKHFSWYTSTKTCSFWNDFFKSEMRPVKLERMKVCWGTNYFCHIWKLDTKSLKKSWISYWVSTTLHLFIESTFVYKEKVQMIWAFKTIIFHSIKNRKSMFNNLVHKVKRKLIIVFSRVIVICEYLDIMPGLPNIPNRTIDFHLDYVRV